MLCSHPFLVCLADQFADHHGCSFHYFSNSLHNLHSYYAITLHIKLLLIFDAEALVCQLKLIIITNFFAGPSFQC